MAATFSVGVGELVDQYDLWMTRNDRVQIHFGEQLAFIFDLSARNCFQAAQQRFSLLAAMGLDNADDDVIAILFARLRLLQHLIGLADARCGAHKNSQLANAPLFAARRFEERLGRGSMLGVAPGICHRVEYYQIGRPETWVFGTWSFETWPVETWGFAYPI